MFGPTPYSELRRQVRNPGGAWLFAVSGWDIVGRELRGAVSVFAWGHRAVRPVYGQRES